MTHHLLLLVGLRLRLLVLLVLLVRLVRLVVRLVAQHLFQKKKKAMQANWQLLKHRFYRY